MRREITLSTGAVLLLRQVPAYALAKLAQIDLPPEPKIEVKTVAGVELVRAPEDSEEYRAWRAEMDRRLREVQERQTLFSISYGVQKWKLPGEEWTDQPPADWALDPALAEMGTGDRRLDYILFELLALPGDFAIVMGALSGVTEEDIRAAESLFRR